MGVPFGMASGGLTHVVLVGRDTEREAIERALESARSGTSATLALVGEAGIGKTALLDDAAERAAGMRVLRARGIESEAQIPFGVAARASAARAGDARPDPGAASSCARGCARAAARPSPGAVRGWGGDAQPARGVRRGGTRGDPRRRRSLARRLQRPGAAVRVPPAGRRPDRGPDRRPRWGPLAARRGRSADVATRRPDQRRGSDPPARAAAGGRRAPARGHRRQSTCVDGAGSRRS